jgi:peptidoglycan/xylan/chitin deacetylase (PgdA/CDA1 family)
MRHLIALLLLLVPALSTRAETPAGGTAFAAIAFHDVVDTRAERTEDAVTTQSLIDFFDWLKAEGWTPVSVDAVLAAGQGGPPLPPKAILLSFDDGYRSFYERVYPLLLAYRYPAVLALVDSWIDTPEGRMVDYGGTPVPRSRFVTWDEVRRMKASGLVEIASHSHDLHRVVPSTPQGNTAPAARTWAFDAATNRYETDAQHRARVRGDLDRARARISAETGAAPRILVWPFGRFSGSALEETQAAGFQLAFTLEPEMADARRPLAIHRYYPTQDPSLGVLAWNLGFSAPKAETVRLVCLDIAPLARTVGADQDAILGRMIEDVRKLGPTGVILAVGPDPAESQPLATVWLPGAPLPMEADIFGRAARQLSVRGGVSVYARLPSGAAARALGDEGLAALAAAAARAAPIDGIIIDGAGVAAPPATAPAPADLRAAREGVSDEASKAFAAAVAIDPRLRLLLAERSAHAVGPPAYAERLLVPDPVDVSALGLAGWLEPATSGRAVLAVPSAAPGPQVRSIRALQAEGATALSLCPFDPAGLSMIAPAFSAAQFPWRP